MSSVNIESGDLLPDLLKGFKNIAGPGSGKTYWLVKNVKNILENSPRIHSQAKIACISYTNNAVKEFSEDLNINSDKVEISTIHSFLYRNLVKPYFRIISEIINCRIDYESIITHVPHNPSSKKVLDWLEWLQDSRIIRNRGIYSNPMSFQNTKDTLSSISWQFDLDNNCMLQLCGRNVGKFSKEMVDNLLAYKKQYWEDGIIHHDDVLYFSYLLLITKPSLIDFLVARYPYVLVDEFQDTSPLQAAILGTVLV
jgi:DNA helicase-2/ATP-dependent DNA helicase PcrA